MRRFTTINKGTSRSGNEGSADYRQTYIKLILIYFYSHKIIKGDFITNIIRLITTKICFSFFFRLPASAPPPEKNTETLE